MRALHEQLGAVFGSAFDTEIVRHYGDPAAEYRAATESVALVDRSHRTRLVLAGRMPAQVIQGVVTGSIPKPPSETEWGLAGRWEYSLVLTPRGRIVSDLRLAHAADEDEAYFMDVPVAGISSLREHFGKYVPPRLATLEDVTESSGMISVLGPAAAELVAGLGLEDPAVLEELDEGDSAWLETGGMGLQVVRAADVHTPQFDLLGGRDRLREIWSDWTEGGARPAGRGVFQTLRVEAGRPAFGQDMTEETLPPEAGVVDRAVDHFKGCYTGQEVIVRIRDRGHVNRHLRGLLIGDGASPAAGTDLFLPAEEKPVGWITSVADSPRAGQTIALGYVRREVEPGSPVRLADPSGPEATVWESSPGWYA